MTLNQKAYCLLHVSLQCTTVRMVPYWGTGNMKAPYWYLPTPNGPFSSNFLQKGKCQPQDEGERKQASASIQVNSVHSASDNLHVTSPRENITEHLGLHLKLRTPLRSPRFWSLKYYKEAVPSGLWMTEPYRLPQWQMIYGHQQLSCNYSPVIYSYEVKFAWHRLAFSVLLRLRTWLIITSKSCLSTARKIQIQILISGKTIAQPHKRMSSI